jgi:hypothetical protein
MTPHRVRGIIGSTLLIGSMWVLQSSYLPAATPKEIDAAVQKGMAYLLRQLGQEQAHKIVKEHRETAESALAGLALLECGQAPESPALVRVTARVREAAFTETQTYHLALYILYLDRLGDPADIPIIQMLGVRLLAGQNSQGGWTYSAGNISQDQVNELRRALLTAELRTGAVHPNRETKPLSASKPAHDFSRLHPAVARYAGQLLAELAAPNSFVTAGDDNSNTQFAILGLWAARKYGVPVEKAFDLIQKRFLATQCANGGWPYAGTKIPGSPSMTCVGLIGLATAVGRRQERLLRSDPQPLPNPRPPAKTSSDNSTAPLKSHNNDPFFLPPPEKAKPTEPDDPFFLPPPPATPPTLPDPTNHNVTGRNARQQPIKPKKHPFEVDPCAPNIHRGFANLAAVLQGNFQVLGKGKWARNFAHAPDFYFLWSLERVGVIYGIETIGNIDWYEYGANLLIASQQQNGSWGSLVNTSFALLFLSRSNVVRDLSRVVQGRTHETELRTSDFPTTGHTNPPEAARARHEPSVPPAPAHATEVTPPRARPTETSSQSQPPAVGKDSASTSSAPPVNSPPPIAPSLPIAPSTGQPLPVEQGLPGAGEAAQLAAGVLRASDAEWPQRLITLKQGKGNIYTQALLMVIRQTDAAKKSAARLALAERLTHMAATTLRQYLQSSDPELRRAAALAIAMKDERLLIPDLVNALLDEDEGVMRAARASLRSLSGRDFGPADGAEPLAKVAAARAWLEWFRQQQP